MISITIERTDNDEKVELEIGYDLSGPDHPRGIHATHVSDWWITHIDGERASLPEIRDITSYVNGDYVEGVILSDEGY